MYVFNIDTRHRRDSLVRHSLAVPSFHELILLQREKIRLHFTAVFLHENELAFLVRKAGHVEEISVRKETVIRILTHRSSLPREKKNR